MRFLSPRVWVGAFAALALGLSAPSAQAGFSVGLNDVFGGGTTSPDPAAIFTFSQESTNVVRLTIDNKYAAGSGNLEKFYLNFDETGGTGPTSLFATLSFGSLNYTTGSGGSVVTVTRTNQQNNVAFNAQKADGTGGDFDFLVNIDNGGNGLAGQEKGFILITGTGLQADMFKFLSVGANTANGTPNMYVAAHVQGVPTANDSLWIGGDTTGPEIILDPNPVPGPGGLVLVASMLPFAWGLRRRLRNQATAA